MYSVSHLSGRQDLRKGLIDLKLASEVRARTAKGAMEHELEIISACVLRLHHWRVPIF